MDEHGMVTVPSGWSVGETIDRTQSVVTEAGLPGDHHLAETEPMSRSRIQHPARGARKRPPHH
jgi:hypothetical protein